ncbi:MAG TPA: GNAT family N-acetyltransferase [Treponemataceae bacterium]|nr:GNAT family N-acetyltransferase [Treponemataceae bacterium]HQL34015.1 GNAT family N-acetyltransferase [Treponemataceae bacterium]
MITIRHARLDEKQKTYEWLCLSDTACMHMGEPDYPENPVPDREQFDEDFEDFYYTGEGRRRGSVMIIEHEAQDGKIEELGCLCYACFHLKPGRAELDIWLNTRKHCGNGYGTEAIRELIKYLRAEFGVVQFIIRPSVRNGRAVAAYRKAGFADAMNPRAAVEDFLLPEYRALYGGGDYGEEGTAVLTITEAE